MQDYLCYENDFYMFLKHLQNEMFLTISTKTKSLFRILSFKMLKFINKLIDFLIFNKIYKLRHKKITLN